MHFTGTRTTADGTVMTFDTANRIDRDAAGGIARATVLRDASATLPTVKILTHAFWR